MPSSASAAPASWATPYHDVGALQAAVIDTAALPAALGQPQVALDLLQSLAGLFARCASSWSSIPPSSPCAAARRPGS